MADLQKTIKGLRCHSEPKFGPDEYFCETCPYDEATCGLDVPNDALSLLKAQEPKVMTLDEVLSQPDGAAIIIETDESNGMLRWFTGLLFCRNINNTTDFLTLTGRKRLFNEEYKKTWRCWTSWTGDEQGDVTPWKN